MTGMVLKPFQDKKTGEIFEIGDEYSAESRRINDLVKKGFIAKSSALKDDA